MRSLPPAHDRIARHQAYWNTQLRPTPEREAYITQLLSGLALEAMEAAGQLKMEFSYA